MNAESLTIPAGGVPLQALLSLPSEAQGLVVFVHGSGSSRFSPRNQAVAERLQQAGLATLLFDPLTPAEAARDQIDQSLRFRIDLFRHRLLDSLRWLAAQPELVQLFPVGLFGASSGAAAALQAAAERPEAVAALVSRGGRPDLAGEQALAAVQAPTLLIVGAEDPLVLQLNQQAARRLRCPHQLEVVPGASHLFEEPGTLELAARLARDWFCRHLPGSMGVAGRSGRPQARPIPECAGSGDRLWSAD